MAQSIIYLLMNHDYEIARLFFENGSQNHFISKVEILDYSRLPFPVKYADDKYKLNELERWILHRIIPTGRDHIARFLEVTNMTLLNCSMVSYGVNLTDGYWFKQEHDNVKWGQINFYQNNFPYDVGNFAFGVEMDQPNLMSPDLTTNGVVQKAWRIRNGKRILIKSGRKPNYDEPFNEVAATEVMRKICSVPFVEYSLTKINGHYYSSSEQFVPENLVLVPADDIYRTSERPKFITVEMHVRERCAFFKIPGYKQFLDNLSYVNYVINNTDCHLGNYGFLYDINTLQFVGPAPIYDPGTSMWNQFVNTIPEEPTNISEDKLNEARRRIHKPEKLLMAKDSKELKDAIESIYSKSSYSPEKISAIAGLVQQRIDLANQCIEIEKGRNKLKKNRGIER